MFLLLLKKQMTELFRGYFVDRKTGKMRPKTQVIMFILLFVGMLVLISNAFSGVAKALAGSLISEGYDWLYFAIGYYHDEDSGRLRLAMRYADERMYLDKDKFYEMYPDKRR